MWGSMVNENKDLSKKLAIVLLVVIIIVSETIILHNATLKFGFHIDELLSFGHSNSSQGGFLFPVNFSGYVTDENDLVYSNWIDPDVFWDYLTVQEDEVFRYSEIVNNLSESVHPPLYYFFLHTVCSFFPETFSKWLGIIPNMVLFSFVLIALYKLSLLLLRSRAKSLLVCSAYGFSLEAVNATLFIRSYLLLTLITLLLVLEIIKLLIDLQPKPSRLVKIFLIAILGSLTHYYFYVFLVIFTILACFYLLLKDQTKLLYSFMGIIIFAILLSFLLSPNAIRHLFFSTRGLESGIRALVGLTVLACISGIFLLIYRMIRKNKGWPTVRDVISKAKQDLQIRLSQSSTNELLFILLFLTVTFTAIVIKLVAPGMDVHSDRYYFNLMPLFSLTGIILIFSLVRRYKPGEKVPYIISSVLLLLSFSSNLFLTSAYLFPASENRALLNQEIKDSICLFITDSDGIIHNFSDVFITTEKVFAAKGISDPSIKNAFSDLESPQKITVIIDSNITQIPNELSILEDQIGYPLQYRYEARHGHFLYRVYSLETQP